MKLEVTESAWESLAELTDYWSDFRSHDVIVRRVDELWDAVDWLLEHPGQGSTRSIWRISVLGTGVGWCAKSRSFTGL